MQLHQRLSLPAGERYFLVGGQLKVNHQLWEHIHEAFYHKFINLDEMNAKEVVFADDSSVAGNWNSIKEH